MSWWYGCDIKGVIHTFEANQIPTANIFAKTCRVNGIEYICIHGPFENENEASIHSKRHVKVKI